MLSVRSRTIRGFSLIEMMVTVAIIIVLMALAAPAFRVWLQNRQVRTVAESIQNGLQLARTEAIRRNCSVDFVLNADTGWTVTARPASGNENVQSRTSTEGSSSSVTVTLASSGTATFDGLGRVTNATPLATALVASTVSGTKSLRVVVGSGGQIRMCDPALDSVATTDPRKCQ